MDLHIGNVLINKSNKVFVIDFDKAKQLSSVDTTVINKMKSRWLKSCKKYNVQKIAGETFILGLEK